MCGIVGYVGSQVASDRPLDVVLEGLRRLEYRGYDSAGVALVSPEGRLATAKKAGKLANLVEELDLHPLPDVDRGDRAHALGHARRTRPTSTPTRTSPASSRSSTTASSRTSRRSRPSSWPRASSSSPRPTPRSPRSSSRGPTRRPGDLTAAMTAVARTLHGTFTLLAVHEDAPDVGRRRPARLAARRRASATGENFLGSDVAAFISHTREALELGQDQVVTITPDAVARHRTSTGRPRRRAATPSTGTPPPPRRAASRSFMDKEIHDQPHAVADTLLGRTDARGRLVLDEIRIDESVLRSVDKIVVVACGTAAYAGHVAKYAIEHWCRIPVEVELAHEFRYRDPVVNERTLVVARLAVRRDDGHAHGRAARPRAGRQGARAREHARLDHPARVRRRALHARRPRDRGRVHQGVPRADHRRLPARPLPRPAARQQVRRRGRRDPRRAARDAGQDPAGARPGRPRAGDRAVDGGHARRCCSSGRHVGFPVAMEGALKLKELAYIHAEGFAAGELKHGPIALIEEGQPVFVIVPSPARTRLAALEGRLQHPGDPRPRCPHAGDRRGRRRGRAARTPTRCSTCRSRPRCWPRC